MLFLIHPKLFLLRPAALITFHPHVHSPTIKATRLLLFWKKADMFQSEQIILFIMLLKMSQNFSLVCSFPVSQAKCVDDTI